MHVSVRVNSDGQITIPRAVREALSIQEGDDVLFRVEGPAGDDRAQPGPHSARRLGERTGGQAGYGMGRGTPPDAAGEGIRPAMTASFDASVLTRRLTGDLALQPRLATRYFNQSVQLLQTDLIPCPA